MHEVAVLLLHLRTNLKYDDIQQEIFEGIFLG